MKTSEVVKRIATAMLIAGITAAAQEGLKQLATLEVEIKTESGLDT